MKQEKYKEKKFRITSVQNKYIKEKSKIMGISESSLLRMLIDSFMGKNAYKRI